MNNCTHKAGPVLVHADGRTTCCQAYTSIFIDDGVEYCKCCYRGIDGHVFNHQGQTVTVPA